MTQAMRGRWLWVAVLAALGCDELPEGTGKWSTVGDTGVVDTRDWGCDVVAGSCACSVDGTGPDASCDASLTCCIYREDDALGATCTCTPDDEAACQERMTGDPLASEVATCPP
ncbi:MAG: hypothetical protein R3F59_29435 [Myxococcota bacterium]